MFKKIWKFLTTTQYRIRIVETKYKNETTYKYFPEERRFGTLYSWSKILCGGDLLLNEFLRYYKESEAAAQKILNDVIERRKWGYPVTKTTYKRYP